MRNRPFKALIVDDEAELRQNLKFHLAQSAQGTFESFEAETGEQALILIEQNDFDLILMDVRMPGISGIETLQRLKEKHPKIFVVIMTAHSNLQDAIAAIREGAYDYLEKPVSAQKLDEILGKALQAREMVSSLALSNPIFDDDIDSEFVGRSSKMTEIFNLIHKLSRVDTTVLVRGENGTGKELVARAIHFNSPRKDGPFLAINCGAIPESLMESELFGHEKGAFTGAVERRIGKFQMATQGTLFLDEIGELKPEMQVKLLRVLQEKKFTPVGSVREVKSGARIIAATNRNLEKMIADGSFREDLFYRLNVMPIFLPPLRERREDIPALVDHFLKKFAKSFSSSIEAVQAPAMEMLKKYPWPGNIRELENCMERAFILEPGTEITVASLPETVRGQREDLPSMPQESAEHKTGTNMQPPGFSGPLDFEIYKEQAEKDFIIQALKSNQGRINQTVATANIPKNTLLRKIRKYGINPDDYKIS